jgi:transcriptional regulator with XRE-family HTH domain
MLYGYSAGKLRYVMSMDIPIGTRLRMFREAKGLSQLQVAMRTGLSLDYIGMVERNVRTASNQALNLMAKALGVPLDVLRGQGQDDPDGHPAIPGIRDAILGIGDPLPVVELATMRGQAKLLGETWFGAAAYDQTGALLPDMIRHAELLRGSFGTPQEETQRREAARLAFDVHFVANHFANAVGASDVAIATRERMVSAADAADDLVTMTSARWLVGLKLIKEGRLDTSEAIVRHQIEELVRASGDELTRQTLLGMMNAAASIVAIRQGDLDRARHYADEAERIANTTGEHSINWSGFGPTNVGIYHVEIAAEHGESEDGFRAAHQIGDVIETMPIAERRSRFNALLAWLYDQQGQDGGVILHLQRARAEAPDELRYSRIAQSLVSKLLRRARSTHRREVNELAAAMGVGA